MVQGKADAVYQPDDDFRLSMGKRQISISGGCERAA